MTHGAYSQVENEVRFNTVNTETLKQTFLMSYKTIQIFQVIIDQFSLQVPKAIKEKSDNDTFKITV